MIIASKLSNICGSVFSGGNFVFAKDKNVIFSPVGNHVSVINLEENCLKTLPFQARSNIEHLAVDSCNRVLVIVDRDGYCITVNLEMNYVSAHFNFKSRVNAVKFSPDSQFLAVCTDNKVFVYESPKAEVSIEPFTLHGKFRGEHAEKILDIEWSPDSRFIISTSKDLKVLIHSLHYIEEFIPFTFTGHHEPSIKCFFSNDMQFFYYLAKDGSFYIWKFVTDFVSEAYKSMKSYKKNIVSGKKVKMEKAKAVEVDYSLIDDSDFSEFEKACRKGRFILHKKEKFSQPNAKIKSAEFNPKSSMLIIGFSNGVFSLYTVRGDETDKIQSFGISEQKINRLTSNSQGSWIAMGISKLGQMIVWEWRSQTYIFNQRGLNHSIECFDFSSNGSIIATGSSDGEVALWDSQSFFCFARFTEHESKVTGVKFMPSSSNALISSSADGTVKAYDTKRYKMFRNMKPDINTQLLCVGCDPNGEIIAAGGFDPYDVYLFDLKTGNLVEIITGHSGPLCFLEFSTTLNQVATASWDKTVRITDLYSKKNEATILEHPAEVTSLCFRPDCKEIATSSMKGEIIIWTVEDGSVRAVLDCKNDIDPGRALNDKVDSKKNSRNKFFRSICYSSDGEFLLAGGNSKSICLYHVQHRVLLKKFTLSINRSMDSTLTKLNSSKAKKLINEDELSSENSDFEERIDKKLPGASKSRSRLRIECRNVKFSPSGNYFACASSDGLQIFSPYQEN